MKRAVGWDIESHLIGPAKKAPKGVNIAFAERVNGAITTKIFLWQEGLDHLETLLADPDVILIAHNHVFDWGCVLAARPSMLSIVFDAFDADRAWDTLVAQKLIDIATGNLRFRFDPATGEAIRAAFSLAALMWRHFNEKLEKVDTWRLRYTLLDGVPLAQWPQEAIDYAIGDAVAALRLYEKQWEDAGEPIPTLGVQVRSFLALHLSSIWGLRTDREAVAVLKAGLVAKVAEARAKLATTTIYKVHKKTGKVSKNMAEIKRRVEEGFAAQDKAAPVTVRGATQTDKESLRDSKDPELLILADIAETDKLLSSFIPVLERGFVSTTYGLAESSRTTSRDVNVQQWPRMGGIRECIVAMIDHLLCSTDYSGIEMCALAQVCLDAFGYSSMADQINAGRDLHIYFGGQIIGLDYDETLRRIKAGDKEAKSARQLAKVFNFGCGGGLGAKAFVEYAKGFGVIISQERAADLIRLWKTVAFPEMQEYFRHIGDLTDCENPTIVHPRSGFVRGGVSYTAACNSFFQERASFGGRLALWNLAKEEYVDHSSPLYGSRTVAWIHDESLLSLPYDPSRPELVAAAANRQAEIMISAMRTVIPDVAIRAEPTLFRKFYKGAEPVYVNGLLVPCKPLEIDGKTTWIADT